MKKRYVFLFFLASLIAACSTDFNINAGWQEITVVYGLLNQKETTHYIKINKAFLGEGNALTMAQMEDSSSYYNNLEVKVEEWKNGAMTRFFGTVTLPLFIIKSPVCFIILNKSFINSLQLLQPHCLKMQRIN